MNNQENMYNVKGEGFVTASYWQKSIHLMTVDQDGNHVDCYDKVVEDMKGRENNVVAHFKKEERKNKWINFLYNAQLKVLIASAIVSAIVGIMYVVFVVMGRADLFVEGNSFIADKLPKALKPYNTSFMDYITAYGLENILMDSLKVMVIISLVALVLFMLGRDFLLVRWFNKMTRIKPLCVTKADSDNRVARLKSDLYNLQLRQHNVKYATHDR